MAIIGSQEQNFMVSFFVDDQELTVLPETSEGVFKDQNENSYNIFGEVIAGPNLGTQLEPTTSYIGYWFSWVAFYPDIQINVE